MRLFPESAISPHHSCVGIGEEDKGEAEIPDEFIVGAEAVLADTEEGDIESVEQRFQIVNGETILARANSYQDAWKAAFLRMVK